VSEGVLDVLAEDRQEQHVAEDVVPAACMNMAVNQRTPQGFGLWHAPLTVHG
jgi:hypothetical protein